MIFSPNGLKYFIMGTRKRERERMRLRMSYTLNNACLKFAARAPLSPFFQLDFNLTAGIGPLLPLLWTGITCYLAMVIGFNDLNARSSHSMQLWSMLPLTTRYRRYAILVQCAVKCSERVNVKSIRDENHSIRYRTSNFRMSMKWVTNPIQLHGLEICLTLFNSTVSISYIWYILC